MQFSEIDKKLKELEKLSLITPRNDTYTLKIGWFKNNIIKDLGVFTIKSAPYEEKFLYKVSDILPEKWGGISSGFIYFNNKTRSYRTSSNNQKWVLNIFSQICFLCFCTFPPFFKYLFGILIIIFIVHFHARVVVADKVDRIGRFVGIVAGECQLVLNVPTVVRQCDGDFASLCFGLDPVVSHRCRRSARARFPSGFRV